MLIRSIFTLIRQLPIKGPHLPCSYCTRPVGVTFRMAKQLVDDAIANNPVTVFSKSYCPFCHMAKKTLADAGLKEYKLFELDERGDMDAIQDYLKQLTGARSVPRVFIKTKCIGGGTETKDLHQKGKLVPMLKDAGAL